MASILFIHKDVAIREIVHNALSYEAHTLTYADDFAAALKSISPAAYCTPPDLVIIDSPGIQILDMCRKLRNIASLECAQILVLTEPKTAQEIAQILDAGGDDCLRKPFSPRELAARARALVRRTNRLLPKAELVINRREKTVRVRDRAVDLTPTEYDLLDVLCQNPGEHIPTAALLERVWQYPPGTGDPALVRNHVRNLRRKLESDPDHPRIVTCFQGRGYTISADIQAY